MVSRDRRFGHKAEANVLTRVGQSKIPQWLTQSVPLHIVRSMLYYLVR